MRIKYESFCNNDEDDQDADVEDGDEDEEEDDDEPDENESLLHHSSKPAPSQVESSSHISQLQQPNKDINNNLDDSSPNIALLQNNINNNMDESLKVVIVNSNG